MDNPQNSEDANQNIENALKDSKTIQDIETTLIELKLQHNAHVRTTNPSTNAIDKIPGLSFMNAFWNKLYFSKIANDPSLFEVKLFEDVLPSPPLGKKGGTRNRKTRRVRRPKRKGSHRSRKH